MGFLARTTPRLTGVALVFYTHPFISVSVWAQSPAAHRRKRSTLRVLHPQQDGPLRDSVATQKVPRPFRRLGPGRSGPEEGWKCRRVFAPDRGRMTKRDPQRKYSSTAQSRPPK